MARLALLFVLALLSACSSLEQFATPYHAPANPASARDADSVIEECQLEAAKQHSRRYRMMPAQYQQAYLDGCYREVTIMRAYGRR